MQRNLNIKSFSCKTQRFFRLWLEFLKPFHKMNNREMEVVAYLLHRRHILYSKIKDDKIVDEILLNKETREDIRVRMGWSTAQVTSNYLSDLRKKGVLGEKSINQGLIPTYEEGSSNFKLILNFSVVNEA